MQKRAWQIAREASVPSKVVVTMLRYIGHPVKSASSNVTLQPFEYQAVVAASKEINDDHWCI